MTPSDERQAGGRSVASPCRGTCSYDAAAGLCRDCGRLAHEIGEWPSATAERRREISAAAALRLAPGGGP
ncbi:DUF1289 domain-containing protein [Neoroseomonas nitratireducens]